MSNYSVLEGQAADLTVQYNDSLEVSAESRCSVTYRYTQYFKRLQFVLEERYCDVDSILCVAQANLMCNQCANATACERNCMRDTALSTSEERTAELITAQDASTALQLELDAAIAGSSPHHKCTVTVAMQPVRVADECACLQCSISSVGKLKAHCAAKYYH
eukprot:6990-Heterococcus_DN1.PRE.9